jgi:hypothetical protein
MEYTKHRITNDILEYFHNEQLTKYIPITENSDYKYRYSAGFEINPNLDVEFPPDITDLVRMHQLVRQRKAMTIMEFGVGYSTLIYADALMKNEEDFDKLPKDGIAKDLVANNRFEIHSTDSSKQWIKHFNKKLKTFPHLKKYIHLHYSELHVNTFKGQMCHFYDQLPDIVPDFIYLDGPCAGDVQGKMCGMSFKQLDRTVMAGDILRMEATLSPGAFILVDGRSNNARFLKNHFKRDWEYYNASQENVNSYINKLTNVNFEDWNDYDYTTFELVEYPLNYWNLKKLELCLGKVGIDKYLYPKSK